MDVCGQSSCSSCSVRRGSRSLSVTFLKSGGMSCTGKCCFCINLRAGVISFACIWLLVDALFLAWMSYLMYGVNEAVQYMLSTHDWDDEDRYVVLGIFWKTVVTVVIYSVAVPMDIMLLVGVIARRRNLVHGWTVAYAGLYVLFLLVTAIHLAFIFFYSPYQGIAPTAGHLVHAGLTVYFWIVVRSYCQELGQHHGEGAPRTTAGKVYRTVPKADVLPPHATYSDAGGIAMVPTAPPPYASNP